MYFTTLPNHKQPGFNEKLHFSRFGKSNIIFNARSNATSCDDHVGCLSIKTVLRGEEWYTINGRSVAVRPGSFLVLNDRQNYSCRIEGPLVNTFSVFFAEDFAKAVFQDAQRNDVVTVDDPFTVSENLPEFYQSLHEFDGQLRSNISGLINLLESEGYNSWKVDEQLIGLLGGLIRMHRSDLRTLKNVRAAKSATQKEIYKRLCIARDLLHSCYRDNLDLKTIATASYLSVPQLVRQFKVVFGTTPHKYLTALRIQHAANLLRSTTISIADIAIDCGFENASAFCRVFKSMHGTQPLSFRIAK